MLANHHAPASDDSPQGDSDYDSILAALMQTARGRAFLHEYASRHRAADTATLLTAIGRIEGLLTSRSLEPAEPLPANDTHPADAAGTAQATDAEAAVAAELFEIAVTETVDGIEAPAEQPIEIEAAADEAGRIIDGPVPDLVEPFAVEVFEVGTIPVGAPAFRAAAIEFLGPELSQVEMPAATPPVCPQRDPFADLRAMSDVEKIALFA